MNSQQHQKTVERYEREAKKLKAEVAKLKQDIHNQKLARAKELEGIEFAAEQVGCRLNLESKGKWTATNFEYGHLKTIVSEFEYTNNWCDECDNSDDYCTFCDADKMVVHFEDCPVFDKNHKIKTSGEVEE